MIKKIISFFSVFLLFASFSFSAKSAEKIALVIGTWAEGPLTPYVEKFTAETGIEVDIQTFPFRDLLATLEVRGNAKADDIDVVFVDAPLVPSYAVRGMIASMDSYFADANVTAEPTKARPRIKHQIIVSSAVCTSIRPFGHRICNSRCIPKI